MYSFSLLIRWIYLITGTFTDLFNIIEACVEKFNLNINMMSEHFKC